MPGPGFPLTLVETIRRADRLSVDLDFPEKENLVPVAGRYDCDENFGVLPARNLSFPYVNPNGKLLAHLSLSKKIAVVEGKEAHLAKSFMYRDNDDNYRIIVSNDTFCNMRFSTLKELLHIHFGILSEGLSLDKVAATLEEAIRSRRYIGSASIPGEAFCYAAAIENQL